MHDTKRNLVFQAFKSLSLISIESRSHWASNDQLTKNNATIDTRSINAALNKINSIDIVYFLKKNLINTRTWFDVNGALQHARWYLDNRPSLPIFAEGIPLNFLLIVKHSLIIVSFNHGSSPVSALDDRLPSRTGEITGLHVNRGRLSGRNLGMGPGQPVFHIC